MFSLRAARGGHPHLVSAQETTLSLQPITDDTGAQLVIGWPLFREAVVGHVVAFDAECVPNNLGGRGRRRCS